MESIPTPPPDVQQQLLVELRTNWQFAAISQFFHLFHTALQMKEWDTDVSDDAILYFKRLNYLQNACLIQAGLFFFLAI